VTFLYAEEQADASLATAAERISGIANERGLVGNPR